MFLEAEDLKSVIYQYQIDSITDNDPTIIDIAINAAIEEVKSYLLSKYNVSSIFGATGSDRHPLILEFCKDVTLWQIIKLSNPDIIYEKVKDRYDRAIDFLNRAARGSVALDAPLAIDQEGKEASSLRGGSMPKCDYGY